MSSGGAPIDVAGAGLLGGGGGAPAGAQGGGALTGYGFVARFTPIPGVTPKSVLKSAVRLPAILNSLRYTDTALHNEYDTIDGGQYSQPASGPVSSTPRQLRDIPLDSLLMAWDPKWFVVTRQHWGDVRNTLRRILYTAKPVHLLVTEHPPKGEWTDIDMHVTLRSMDVEIKAGEADTRYLTFDIKQWRDPRVREESHRPGTLLEVQSVTIDSSTTLEALAGEWYGRASDWRYIRDANGITTKWGGSTPLVKLGGRWKAGAKIVIPAIGL